MATELLETLTDDERDSLRKVLKASARYPTGKRNSAMIMVALTCGLRSSEICGHERRDAGGLRIGDIDLQSGKLTLKDTKDTRKKSARSKKSKVGRVVYADGLTLNALRLYWQVRSSMADAGDSTAYFFVSRLGSRVLNRGFRAAFERYASRAGIDASKCHPHILRHTYATIEAVDVPLHILQKTMGHASLQSTARYLHASNDDVKKYMTREGRKL
jgi:integrase/recombinase XerD